MFGLKVMAMYNGESQMVGFCLVVEFHLEGLATNGATLSCYKKRYIKTSESQRGCYDLKRFVHRELKA